MPISATQASFTGGEWSPSLHARVDLAKYATATRTMRNMFPHPHGGCSNRPGFEFLVATKTHAKTSRLVPFQFSVVQSYVLEFGDQYVRFVKDGGQIVSAKTITGAANNGAGLIRISSTAHGFQTGNTVTVASVAGTTEANGTWIVTVIGADTYDLQASAFVHAYTSGGTGTAIVEVSTPYIEADLPLLKFEQSADVLYITHPSYEPRKLSRSSHTAWTLSTITFAPSIAAPTGLSASGGVGKTYAVTAVTADGIESIPSSTAASTNSNTLSWTASTGAVEYNIYESVNSVFQHVGKSGTVSYAIPASYVLNADISAPKATNPFSGAGNYPGVSAFFDQRLIFGRTNNKPQSIFGSVVGDFENMNVSSPIKDDDAFNFTINSSQVNEIRWMMALSDLIIGTSGAEWKLAPGGQTNAVTPTSVKLSPQSRWGVADIQPILVGNSVLFVDGSTKKVRDLLYSLEKDGYDGSDLTIMAQHFFETYGIKEWAYQRHPDSIIWAVRTDGTLTGLTYQKEHQVFGWHRHDTAGTFESITTIQTSGGASEVYCVVNRTIGGATKRYIERLHSRTFATVADSFFVDSGLTYSGASATVISGLSHLEGKAVAVLADGNVADGLTVSGGTITIPNAAVKVHVGLPFVCDLETLGFEYATRTGTLQDKMRRIVSVVMRFKETRSCWIGPDADHLDEVKFRDSEDYGLPTAVFTGDKEVLAGPPADARQGRLFMRVTDPLPVTVQAVIARMDNGEK